MQNYCCVTAAVTDRHSKRLQNRFNLIHFCYSYIKFMLIKAGLLVLVEQPKQMVALRPPLVADKGSNALSEITSNRKHIYVQRIATIFQTGERGSPLHCIVEKVTILHAGIICVKSHRFYNRYDWRSLTAATDYTQFSSHQKLCE